MKLPYFKKNLVMRDGDKKRMQEQCRRLTWDTEYLFQVPPQRD